MTWLKLTNETPGAPPLAAVNGMLCEVLDWALPQAGWAIEFTSGNARIYRPGSGHRRRLYVNHDSAVSGSVNRALVRGCESATEATAPVDSFPKLEQVVDANSNWHISTLTTSATRPWVLYVSDTFLILLVNVDASLTNPSWSMGMFGDVPTAETDEWGTVCLIRNSNATTVTATNSTGIGSPTNSMLVASQQLFWCRSIDGTVKSTHGALNASGTTMGQVAGAPALRAGWLGRINREKVRANCLGSSTTTPLANLSYVKRGSIPNLWSPLHNGRGTVTTGDPFTDSAYNPSAQFRVYACNNNTATCIIEETDTWGPGYG